MGAGYIKRTGFLSLADEHNIVMLFPQVLLIYNLTSKVTSLFQVKASTLHGNPLGCWDWSGGHPPISLCHQRG